VKRTGKEPEHEERIERLEHEHIEHSGWRKVQRQEAGGKGGSLDPTERKKRVIRSPRVVSENKKNKGKKIASKSAIGQIRKNGDRGREKRQRVIERCTGRANSPKGPECRQRPRKSGKLEINEERESPGRKAEKEKFTGRSRKQVLKIKLRKKLITGDRKRKDFQEKERMIKTLETGRRKATWVLLSKKKHMGREATMAASRMKPGEAERSGHLRRPPNEKNDVGSAALALGRNWGNLRTLSAEAGAR